MKLQAKLLAAAALAAGVFSVGQASATELFSGTYNAAPGSNLYIGSYNSLAEDSALIRHSFGNPAPSSPTPFEDRFVFDFNGGSVSSTISFNPFDPATNGLSPFSVQVFAVTGGTCPSTGLGVVVPVASSCSGLTLAAVSTINGTPGFSGSLQNGAAFPFTGLAFGRYALVVKGTVTGTPVQYTGSFNTNAVPEPGSLALAGIALVGLAATLRKRKTA